MSPIFQFCEHNMSVGDLSEKQIKDFQEAFRLFDRDHDGNIETSVLGTVIRSLGCNPTNAQIGDIITQLNSPDGLIDFSTFLVIMAKQVQNLDIEGDIKRAWSVFDKEKAGKILTNELRHYLVSVGETLSEDEANAMMAAADPTNSGYIEYNHFLKMMIGVH